MSVTNCTQEARLVVRLVVGNEGESAPTEGRTGCYNASIAEMDRIEEGLMEANVERKGVQKSRSPKRI